MTADKTAVERLRIGWLGDAQKRLVKDAVLELDARIAVMETTILGPSAKKPGRPRKAETTDPDMTATAGNSESA